MLCESSGIYEKCGTVVNDFSVIRKHFEPEQLNLNKIISRTYFTLYNALVK